VTSQDTPPGALPGTAQPERDEAPSFDITRAHPARVYNYWLGGKDNYEPDRVAAREVITAMPNILPTARANRAFLRRVVQYLVEEAGIRQFLDIGTGLPTAQNTHEVAQQIAPYAVRVWTAIRICPVTVTKFRRQPSQRVIAFASHRAASLRRAPIRARRGIGQVCSTCDRTT
jgi:phage gp37-like protein